MSRKGSRHTPWVPAFKCVKKSMSGAGILPASNANSGGNAWLPASPERGRDARATRFSFFLSYALIKEMMRLVHPIAHKGKNASRPSAHKGERFSPQSYPSEQLGRLRSEPRRPRISAENNRWAHLAQFMLSAWWNASASSNQTGMQRRRFRVQRGDT